MILPEDHNKDGKHPVDRNGWVDMGAIDETGRLTASEAAYNRYRLLHPTRSEADFWFDYDLAVLGIRRGQPLPDFLLPILGIDEDSGGVLT